MRNALEKRTVAAAAEPSEPATEPSDLAIAHYLNTSESAVEPSELATEPSEPPPRPIFFLTESDSYYTRLHI